MPNVRQYKKLEEIKAYQVATELENIVWNIVLGWEWFSKKTVGVQYVESSDSVSANIAEGFGRYHKKDKIKFYLNARGSVYEDANWTKKAFLRKLLSEKECGKVMDLLRKLPKEINYLIKVTKENLKE